MARTHHEYAIGPSRCIIGGSLESTRAKAVERMAKLAQDDNWPTTDRNARIYCVQDGRRLFIGTVRPDGRYIPVT